ncbi:MAG: glycoside hydrolase family 3 protein, partial [Clostridia bacterium]|nr:glycoside hydrolase family 3 protein [Clostridia bacterium]
MKITAETEKKIEELLNDMTTEEKVAMCHANSKFTSSGAKRFGIGELCMMDGPHGVRSEVMRDEWTCLNREEDRCTYLPTLSALAATFNTDLSRMFGETLGSEARYRAKDIILGPGINIMRTPLCGRNFEYMSEDPCLIAKLSPEVVKGIESQDVAACVKHYALNNQELDRNGVNVEVSERAQYEIYLKGFYAAIIKGGASSVMGAYNRYNNQHLCHNKYLVNEVLKGKWGFKGVYLSDWGGCHDTEEAIFCGLDIEMGTNKPYDEYYLANAFIKAAKTDENARKILDDKVRRILRLMFSVNKTSPERKKGEFNTKKHQRAAYDIASEAIVLLKNNDMLLPIKKARGKKILVVGPNATAKHAEGGSSSGVRALYEVTLLEGIKSRFSPACEVRYESGNLTLNANPIPNQQLNVIEQRAGVRAFKQTAYIGDNEYITYTADAVLSDRTADS